MKLIIDIPEDEYRYIKEYYDEATYSHIYHGIPLNDILQEIRQEITELGVDLQDGSEDWRSYVNDTVLECLEIIDKYIKKIKESDIK